MMRSMTLGLAIMMMSWSITVLADSLSCDEAYTTLALNQCEKQALTLNEQQLEQTWLIVIERYQRDEQTVAALQQAQTQWQQYRTAHCQSIATQWRQGSIKELMFLHCHRRLTQQREEELRTQFLID